MVDDYRNTTYRTHFSDIARKKEELINKIRINHPRTEDMYSIISPNNSTYKDDFMKIYDYKCSYCGVSIDVIPRTNFEVDHFIFKESEKFKENSKPGNIENLVLACHDCNRSKGTFEIPDNKYIALYPDKEEIKRSFIRDENFYIKISDEKNDDETINSFYKKLELGSEMHRVDYLLMSMIELKENISGNICISSLLGDAIDKLHTKRNLMSNKNKS